MPHPHECVYIPCAVELDEGVVMQLVSMGFDMEGCKRAVYHTQNQGVEPAMNWVLEHMGDPGMHNVGHSSVHQSLFLQISPAPSLLPIPSHNPHPLARPLLKMLLPW